MTRPNAAIRVILSGILLIIVACGGGGGGNGGTAVPNDVVVQLPVGATGATLEVTDPTSPYYGTKLDIPAGAVGQTTTITVRSVSNPDVVNGNIGFELEPSGTIFSSPLELTMPISDAIEKDLGMSMEDLRVFSRSAAGEWELTELVDLDTTTKRIKVKVGHFSFFGVHTPRTFMLQSQERRLIDGTPETYQIGITKFQLNNIPTGSPFQTIYTPLLIKYASGVQVSLGKGTLANFWKAGQKNLLIIHGIISNPTTFLFDDQAQLNHDGLLYALKNDARFNSMYDNIVLYQYPSGRSIDSNAEWLANELRKNVQTSCKIDIIAHSMGGLITRVMVETYGISEINKVVMIGTPNNGGLPDDILGFFFGSVLNVLTRTVFVQFPGVSDLQRQNTFFLINAQYPGKKSAQTYYVAAGNVQSSNYDGIVTVDSATKAFPFISPEKFRVFPGLNHSDLHRTCRTNGVLAQAKEWLTGTINVPPVVNAGVDQLGKVNTLFTLTGTATDADNDPIVKPTWTQTAGTSVTLSSATTLSTTFTPTVAGTYTFQLTVSDSLQEGSDTVMVTVNPSNGTPVANAGTDKSGWTGISIPIDGSGSSDPDNDPITYLWVQTGGPSVTLPDTTLVTTSFVPPSAGSYTFSLTVNDGTASSVADTVVLTIIDPKSKTFQATGDTFYSPNNTWVATLWPDRDTFNYLNVGVDGGGTVYEAIIAFHNIHTAIPATATILSADFVVGRKKLWTSGTVTATDAQTKLTFTDTTSSGFTANVLDVVKWVVANQQATAFTLTSDGMIEYTSLEGIGTPGTITVKWIE